MRKFCIILISILSLSTGLPAQNISSKSDSLKSLLKTAKNDTGRVNMLNDLVANLILSDRYDSANIVANEALILSEQLDYQPGVALSLRRMGVGLVQQGEYSRGLECLFGSLKINESMKNNDEIFKINNNIGNTYYGQGNYKSAIEYFMKAYAYKKNDAFTNSNIGITYLAERNYRLALVFLEKALALYSQTDDEMGLSNTINYIGTVYESQGSYGQALDYYCQALKIKEEIGDIQGQADALGGIGDIKMRQNLFDEAIAYQNKSILLATEIGYLISVQESQRRLSEAYEAIGQKDKAFDHYKIHISIRDSLYSSEELRKTVSAEMNFDFSKKRAVEMAIHDEELKRQQTVRNAFMTGFLLVIIFSMFMIRSYKRERKQKNIIKEQKRLVDHKNQEITDSINYAQKIQRAILPSTDYMNKLFPEHFVSYQPRDIVSGDFYWSFTDGVSKYLATADCTGHSVPGAMMSMVGTSLLNEIVIERGIKKPDQILNVLRDEIIRAINHEGADEERKDGMDISLVKITNLEMESAGANNSIYIVRNGSLMEIKADRFPIGKYITHLPFTLNTTELKNGDTIYMQSDGFADQFGGEKGKKLMIKRFKEWIIELSSFSMQQVKLELESRFNSWKGTEPQVDDVTVLGIRI